MSKREGLKDSSETYYDLWFGDGGTGETTEGRPGRSRTEDAKILLGRDRIRNLYIRGTGEVDRWLTQSERKD